MKTEATIEPHAIYLWEYVRMAQNPIKESWLTNKMFLIGIGIWTIGILYFWNDAHALKIALIFLVALAACFQLVHYNNDEKTRAMSKNNKIDMVSKEG
jgi:hypothetical protein